MKKILLPLLAVCISLQASAQSFSVSNLLIEPSVIDPTTLVATLKVTNNGNSAKQVMCQRVTNNLFSGHLSSFCWYLCYGTQTNLSSDPLTIAAGGENTAFIGDLYTSGLIGASDVSYSFFDQSNPSDQVTVNIQYNYTTGINTISTDKGSISSARPNPADNFTTINFNLKNNPADYILEVSSLLGARIAQYSFSSTTGTLTIPTQNLINGVYFYSLKEKDKTISSQKLVVSHR